MKKMLFCCVAGSVLITAVAFAQFEKQQKQSDVSLDAQTIEDKAAAHNRTPKALQNNDQALGTEMAKNENKIEDIILNERTYTADEEQIQEAFENYLYMNDMEKTVLTDVKEDGKDFIITVTNPSDPTKPSYEMRLKRIEDFNGKRQYTIVNNSDKKWAKLTQNFLTNPTIQTDSYTETLSWIPDLKLKTKQSIKTNNVTMTADEGTVHADNIVSDYLVGQNGDKMDVASSTEINGLTLVTPLLKLQIPRLIHMVQISGAEQTGDETLQALTAVKSYSSTNIPQASITSAFLDNQTLSGSIETRAVFDSVLTLEAHIKNINLTGNLLPLMPESITAEVSIDGVSKELLIAYVNMQQQLAQMEEDTPEAQAMAQKLVAAQNQILSGASLKIDDLSIMNKDAGIQVTGTIHYAEPAPTVNVHMTVTNFDLISPKEQPINQEECKKALQTTTPPTDGTPVELPAACVQQGGVLEALRPFIDIAKQTKNDKGQTVDTFDIVYSANALTINGQSILPEQQTNKNGTTTTTADMSNDTGTQNDTDAQADDVDGDETITTVSNGTIMDQEPAEVNLAENDPLAIEKEIVAVDVQESAEKMRAIEAIDAQEIESAAEAVPAAPATETMAKTQAVTEPIQPAVQQSTTKETPKVEQKAAKTVKKPATKKTQTQPAKQKTVQKKVQTQTKAPAKTTAKPVVASEQMKEGFVESQKIQNAQKLLHDAEVVDEWEF